MSGVVEKGAGLRAGTPACTYGQVASMRTPCSGGVDLAVVFRAPDSGKVIDRAPVCRGHADEAAARVRAAGTIADVAIEPLAVELEPSTVETVDAQLVELPERARQLVDGLRALAAMVERQPDTAEIMRWTFSRVLVSVSTREEVAAMARAGAGCAAARVTKHQDNAYAGVDVSFGEAVSLHVYASREQVCERIVVGTRTETKEVPDPEALAAVPKVTVTEVVEDVEWRCHPILAAALPGGAS